MSIVDKAKGLYDSHKDQIQDGINKGKELVNKAMGGRHSAQTTSPGQGAQESGADAGVSSPGAASSGAATSGAAADGAAAAGEASPGAASPGEASTEAGTQPPAAPTTDA
jgi:MT0933-like antitoxin protein